MGRRTGGEYGGYSPDKTLLALFTGATLLSGAAAATAAVNLDQMAPAIAQARLKADSISPDLPPDVLARALITQRAYQTAQIERSREFNPQVDAAEAMRPEVLAAQIALAQHQAHEQAYRSIATQSGNLASRETFWRSTLAPTSVFFLMGLLATIGAALGGWVQQVFANPHSGTSRFRRQT